ncbi:hypothetical protein Acor_69470 [Acrocarpospora corrugata]|uniref:Uncharacterized protein n=1 Tax=Acrocarpospora corrugata TaxID=35763 RepID=A0A5M3W953_9ACTN|nr:hypothetical protein [Acrocarpospora corrugata]GES04879.1 hypothetical protein Acor_69470 [Acrocarpospora corrugata]
MLYSIIVLASLTLGLVALSAFVLVVHSIRREDRRRSLTLSPRSVLSSGTRRILGLAVDHTACVIHPEYACPTCIELEREVRV